MRTPSAGDYQLKVEGLGDFVVSKRRMRDEFAIAAEYSRLTEGVPTPTDFLHFYARAFATIKTLVVQAPSGWNVEELDPNEESSYAQMIAVFDAIRAREDDFRRKP